MYTGIRMKKLDEKYVFKISNSKFGRGMTEVKIEGTLE